VAPEGRRVKVYHLTAEGRKQFAVERAGWTNFTQAVERLLEAT
jgi:DNA-binding PadR family transcriptional regulator